MEAKQETREFIKHLRKRTGLTQKEFSQKYNIPFDTLAKWEAGLRNPPAYVVELLDFRIQNE